MDHGNDPKKRFFPLYPLLTAGSSSGIAHALQDSWSR